MTRVKFFVCVLFITSCAGQKVSESQPQPRSGQKLNSVNEVIQADRQAAGQSPSQDEAEIPERILGAYDVDHGNSPAGKVYYLYGAEHLKLENYYFDIPVVYNDSVKFWINYFLSRGREFFIRYANRSGRYAPVLSQILTEHGLPKDLIFLAMAESGFQNKAKSWAKAVGPWQFMPMTAKSYGLKIDWYLDERRDPIKSTISAARYLKDLYRMFETWELAAAGYNAGEGKVSRAVRRYKTENFWKLRRFRYLKKETKNYVPKIMALAIIGKNLKSFGFESVDFYDPLDFEEVEIPGNTDLMALSADLNISYDEIHRLNPELLRWQTPPNVNVYKLRVPPGGTTKFKNCCQNKLLSYQSQLYQTYTMKSNSSINSVAKKFKLPVHLLAKLNGVIPGQKMGRGDLVKLPFRIGQSHKAPMYADLYEKPSRRIRKRRRYQSMLRRAYRRGKKVANPTQYYTVRKGDTLWNVSQKMGVPLNTLIKTNYRLVKRRMIQAGDRLAIR